MNWQFAGLVAFNMAFLVVGFWGGHQIGYIRHRKLIYGLLEIDEIQELQRRIRFKLAKN